MLNAKVVVDIKTVLSGLNTEELLEATNMVIALYKASRTMDSVVKKSILSVGQKVEWTGRKGHHTGRIAKINRTKAVVTETGMGLPMTWTVPMSMLKVIE
jgi:hypothetical protein